MLLTLLSIRTPRNSVWVTAKSWKFEFWRCRIQKYYLQKIEICSREAGDGWPRPEAKATTPPSPSPAQKTLTWSGCAHPRKVISDDGFFVLLFCFCVPMMITLFLFESSGGVGALSLEVLVVCDSESKREAQEVVATQLT